jgi:hypothetical protein
MAADCTLKPGTPWRGKFGFTARMNQLKSGAVSEPFKIQFG